MISSPCNEKFRSFLGMNNAEDVFILGLTLSYPYIKNYCSEGGDIFGAPQMSAIFLSGLGKPGGGDFFYST
jgi:hypothetical protein